jgi:hypothetical protein
MNPIQQGAVRQVQITRNEGHLDGGVSDFQQDRAKRVCHTAQEPTPMAPKAMALRRHKRRVRCDINKTRGGHDLHRSTTGPRLG